MKKIIAMILVIATIASMGIVSVFAEYLDDSGQSKEFTILADYIFIPSKEEVYGVNITWTDMVFTYTVRQGNWDPNTLTRENKASWDAQEKSTTITIENRSNTDITAEASYTAEAISSTAVFEYEGLEDNCMVIGRAEEGDGEGQIGTIEAIVTIAENSKISSDITVGKITVTIY